MTFLDTQVKQFVAAQVNNSSVQQYCRGMGKYLGNLLLQAASKPFDLSMAPKAAAGTWEADVINPLMSPIMDGLKEVLLPALAGIGGKIVVSMVATHAAAFLAGRLTAPIGRRPSSPVSKPVPAPASKTPPALSGHGYRR